MENPSHFALRLAATFAAAAVLTIPATGALTQRWSFNNNQTNMVPSGTPLVDSVSGTVATVRGNYSRFTGTALTLRGPSGNAGSTTDGRQSSTAISGYVDLPNGLISSRTDLSVEIWATPHTAKNWMRLFDFGTTDQPGIGPGAVAGEIIDAVGSAPGTTEAADNLRLTFTNGVDLNAQRAQARFNFNSDATIDTTLATSANTQYHYVLTYKAGEGIHGTSGGRMQWYRNGALAGSVDVAYPLSALRDVNNWLGRSQFTADSNAHASYNEVRLYNHALSPAEISADYTAGPDTIPGPPVPPPVPDHIWTFTSQAASEVASGRVFLDAKASRPVILRGNGGSLDGRAVILPGTSNGNQPAAAISAYLDLPNGIVSASANVSFEAWAAPLSSKNWQRLFDFGRCVTSHGEGAAPGEILDTSAAPGGFGGYDNLSLTFNNAGNLNSQQLEGQYHGNPPQFSFSTANTVAGTRYHYVLTVEDITTGCRVRWYRNGVQQNTADFPFHLSEIEDVNNWIGRSMYSGDSNSHLSLDELRIYRRALTPQEILASQAAGPDPSVGPPEPPAPAPLPRNRWTFNAPARSAAAGDAFTDTISGEIATVRGNNASLDGDQLVLPVPTTGNQNAAAISAYLDLPNGIVSAKNSASFEIWSTPSSSRNWQRLFDFGRGTVTSGPGAAAGEIIDSGTAPGTTQGYDNLFLSWNVNAALGNQQLEGKLAGTTTLATATDLSSVTTAGQQYHVVLTVQDEAGAYGPGGCQAKWYRDGALQGTLDLSFHLRDMADVNNWIGRSQWSADSNSHMTINELRIYDRAISLAEVKSSLAAGPNAVFPAPTAVADSATINPGGKVLLKVLANDTGLFNPSTVQIVSPPANGTATVRPSGEILYAHSGTGGEEVTFSYRVSGEGGPSAAATVTIAISAGLRIANPDLNVPANPPPTAVQVVPAYPGVTFSRPLCFVSPPGDAKRLFVCEISGKLKVIPDVTASSPTSSVVLDMAQVIANPPRNPVETLKPGGNPECGLLGLAFHPNFSTNGYFYVAYSVGKANDSAVWYQRLSRFTVPQAQISSPAPVADPASELILLEQRDRDDNHNGGDLHFGADGYLYWALGDEANPNDHRRNSQRIDMNFFGALLRIDVDKKSGNLEPNAHTNPAAAALGFSTVDGIPRDEIPAGSGNLVARYSIPLDNPYVSSTRGGPWDGTFNGSAIPAASLPYIRSEFYAVGLRSPWRFSIDPVTQEIWLGDVGQDTYEELDLITKGGNYGWAHYEGVHNGPRAVPSGFSSIPPVYEYPHNNQPGDSNFKGNSIIGGVVYRGSRFSSLTGAYIFGDNVSGNIWALTRPNGVVQVQRIAGQPYLTTFGTDPSNGDVLVSDYNGGRIMRIITTTPAAGFPTTLSATGLFSDLSDLSPAPGVLPYEPNLRFWSDHAIKRRWFTIPDAAAKMTWSRDQPWTFPNGEIWIKHFDLESIRGDSASAKKRIETRLLVKNDSGVYGVSYRWNAAGTEATLAADGGEDIPVQVTVDGAPYTQQWRIPSRSECLTCHSPQAGYALSFNTRQLNLNNTINGVPGNQIDLLHANGFLANTPDNTDFLPRHYRPDETDVPLEERVRSYLAVNCSYCHAGPDGTAAVAWDGRAERTLEQTGLINGPSGTANAPYKLVVPGTPAHSVILQRMAAASGFSRMPPLATSELDEEGNALVSEWIANFNATGRFYADWRQQIFGATAGAPGEDADGDGMTNHAEFLAGTDPLSGSSLLLPNVANSGTQVALDFNLPPNRTVRVHTSENLDVWQLWDTPQNSGLTFPGGPTTISGPATGPSQYFRLQIEER